MVALTSLTKSNMRQYVAHVLDDALSSRPVATLPANLDNVRIVGWTCGFEPMCVAVLSYLPGIKLDEEDAVSIAIDWLEEIGWFADPTHTEPDFVL